jgi:hypothetical protein
MYMSRDCEMDGIIDDYGCVALNDASHNKTFETLIVAEYAKFWMCILMLYRKYVAKLLAAVISSVVMDSCKRITCIGTKEIYKFLA